MSERSSSRSPSGNAEVGYLLHSPFWRQGYATEAALGVRAYSFEQRRYLRVISLIRPENLSSQVVARRRGMNVIAETSYVGLTHLVFGIAAEQVEARPSTHP